MAPLTFLQYWVVFAPSENIVLWWTHSYLTASLFRCVIHYALDSGSVIQDSFFLSCIHLETFLRVVSPHGEIRLAEVRGHVTGTDIHIYTSPDDGEPLWPDCAAWLYSQAEPWKENSSCEENVFSSGPTKHLHRLLCCVGEKITLVFFQPPHYTWPRWEQNMNQIELDNKTVFSRHFVS